MPEFRRVVQKGGMRLDKYLYVSGLGVSRSWVKKLIEEGRVYVNGRVVKAHHRVQPGEEVVVHYDEKPVRKVDILPQNIDIDIVYEDDYLVVVNKAPGLVVHPARGAWDGTLVNALLYHIGKLSPGGDYTRPGVVHRLDKDTSGLIVFAKDPRAHTGLARQISEKTARRVYFTIVWGDVPLDAGTIEAPVGRSTLDRTRMTVTPLSARKATTHYKVLYRFGIATVLKVILGTGRTHQIRVHMEHLGYPVVGDPIYGGRKETILQRIGLEWRGLFEEVLGAIGRQALHAALLGFVHPITGEKMEFTAPLPDDIKDVLGILRRRD